jgi:CRISPR-associated protein Cas5d
MPSQRYCLEVTADFACFTRPEMKVERVSYDLITPSAARAVFDAIYWKPAVRWHVRRVEVLKPIRWINLRRNEVASKISVRNVEQAIAEGSGNLGLYVEEDRQQRAGLFLRDVAYRLHADLEVLPGRDDPEPPQKHFAIFERRVDAGQCVNQPYLGCREFSVTSFRRIAEPRAEPAAIAEDRDLGWMLYDMDFANAADPQPVFFRASMQAGVVECDWREVAKTDGSGVAR